MYNFDEKIIYKIKIVATKATNNPGLAHCYYQFYF